MVQDISVETLSNMYSPHCVFNKATRESLIPRTLSSTNLLLHVGFVAPSSFDKVVDRFLLLFLGLTFCARKKTLADLQHLGDCLNTVFGDVFCVGREPVTHTFKTFVGVFKRGSLASWSDSTVAIHGGGGSGGSGYLMRWVQW